jgi:cell wall assembly regulator SMI1
MITRWITERGKRRPSAVWTDLERLFAAEPTPLRLAPPATAQDVDRCEQRLGLRFPDDLREAYLRHDGGEFPDSFRWHSLAEVAAGTCARCWRRAGASTTSSSASMSPAAPDSAGGYGPGADRWMSWY